jgi:hypothetical protein
MYDLSSTEPDYYLPSEIELAKAIAIAEDYSNTIGRLIRVSDQLEANPNMSETETELLYGSVQDIMDRFLDIDEEAKRRGAFSPVNLTAALLDKVRKLLVALLTRFGDFLADYFSMLNVRAKQAAKQVEEINQNFHKWVEERPTISFKKSVEVLMDEKYKLIDPNDYTALIDSAMTQINPDLMQKHIQSQILAIPGQLANIETREDTELLMKQVKIDTMRLLESNYNMQIAKVKDYDIGTVRIKNIPMMLTLKTRKDSTDVPSVKLVSPKRRKTPPKTIEAYSPQQAFIIASASHRLFTRILDDDKGRKVRREINRLIKDFKTGKATDAHKDALRLLPKWASFMSKFTKAAMDYEYRIGMTGLVAVNLSRDKWKMRD